jgi:hypothetical protein
MQKHNSGGSYSHISIHTVVLLLTPTALQDLSEKFTCSLCDSDMRYTAWSKNGAILVSAIQSYWLSSTILLYNQIITNY